MSHGTLNDSRTGSSFLGRVRAREPEAWAEFVDLYGPLVFAWSRACGLDSPDAADVTQDVFLAVDQAIGRFQSAGVEGAFRGWLHTITQNKVRDLYRKRGRQFPATGGTTMHVRLGEVAAPLSDISLGSVSAASSPSVTDPVGGLYRRALRMVRDEVAEKTWLAFWAIAVEQRPTADVADELEMSENSVRQAKSRVLRRLRERLGDLPGEK